MMHRNNGPAFLLPQIDFESSSAITPYRVSFNEHIVGVFPTVPGPRWTAVMCLARLSMAPISYMQYLHVGGACCSSLSPSPRHPRSNYLHFPPYVSHPPYFCLLLQLPTYIR